jgi:bacillolysin
MPPPNRNSDCRNEFKAMQIEKNQTGKRTSRFRSTLDSKPLPFRKGGWLKLAWIAMFAALVFSTETQAVVPSAGAEDPRSVPLATRVSKFIGEVAATAPANVPAQAADRDQEAAVRQLVNQAADVQVRLRPGNQTVMQLRGSLVPTAQGAGLLGFESHERTARKFFAGHSALMHLSDPENELALVRNHRDGLGYEHLRFNQQYNGLPVWPAQLDAHFDPTGNLTLIEGAYVPTPQLDSVAPALTGTEAVARATTEVASGRTASASAPKLIIYASANRLPRLSWKFDLTAALSEAWSIVVDAQDGSILHRSSLVFEVQAKGSGVDLVGQTRPLNLWQTNSTYYLVDTSKKSFDPAFDPLIDAHGIIAVVDAGNAPYWEVITGLDTIPFLSSSAADRWTPPDAVSAAYTLSEVFDYYWERHGRNSIDGQGGNVFAVVGIGEADTAVWSDYFQLMLFGNVRPWAAALDVTAHELTHGIVQFSASLGYDNQSGALNEAFADIFGEMVEARTRGTNDWVIGTDLNEKIRNLKEPGSLTTEFGRPYPSKMSEYAQLADTDKFDSGGAHVNATIVGHAFYLLAEGLNGAIGRRSAESIFYRCLMEHLPARAQFADCRLGCIAAANELFGKDSTEVRLTSQAFDAVEIFDAPRTPAPIPVPVGPGLDSTIFVSYDLASDQYNLGRREVALDKDLGITLAAGIVASRPSVTANGEVALFVSSNHNLASASTADTNSGQELRSAGQVFSVAISPDAKFVAFVPLESQTGHGQPKIALVDLMATTATTNDLVAPSADGTISTNNTVLRAYAITFSPDGADLIYDALIRQELGAGRAVESWGIYSLHLATRQTSVLVAPQDGVDAGNPAVGHTGNRYLAYDSHEVMTGITSIMVMDLLTGQKAKVAAVTNVWGSPSFLSDDSGLVYTAPDPLAPASGLSLLEQDLTADRLHSQGPVALWLSDASMGLIYRRSSTQSTNQPPTVTLQLSADSISTQVPVTLMATATDPDGTVVRVVFYDGSTRLGQADSAPYTFVWKNATPGNHLVSARAVDNAGAETASSPKLLTVSGTEHPGPTVTLNVQATAPSTVRLTVSGDPGHYIISMSEDLKTWVDIYPVTVGTSGTGSVDDSGGPLHYSHLFYRARPD